MNTMFNDQLGEFDSTRNKSKFDIYLLEVMANQNAKDFNILEW